AAKRSRGVKVAHTLADTMRHEPSRLVRQADHAVKLMSRNALLAGAHEMRRQKPFRHRNVRALVNRADSRRKLATAILAVIPARSHRLAAKRLHRLSLAAERTIGPVR